MTISAIEVTHMSFTQLLRAIWAVSLDINQISFDNLCNWTYANFIVNVWISLDCAIVNEK